MAAEIKTKMGFDTELIGGGGGIFDVHADDQLVFSKHNEGDQFPEHSVVLERLTRIESK